MASARKGARRVKLGALRGIREPVMSGIGVTTGSWRAVFRGDTDVLMSKDLRDLMSALGAFGPTLRVVEADIETKSGRCAGNYRTRSATQTADVLLALKEKPAM